MKTERHLHALPNQEVDGTPGVPLDERYTTNVRAFIQQWLAHHPRPSPQELASAGLVAPHWPVPWGLDALPLEQLIIDEELTAAGIRKPRNLVGIGWVGPTLLVAGTEAQRERFLPGLLTGEEQWCQLFSEPDFGSDLASLQTAATPTNGGYSIRGQKIWSSMAHWAKFGILLARTNTKAPEREGITYFICAMNSPGITIRPIVDMTGDHSFNEVFLDDVFIPEENIVGMVDHGWKLAKVTLENERVTLSKDGAIWGRGPTALDLIDLARASGGVDDELLRQRVTQIFVEGKILQFLRLRLLARQLSGQQPGPEASIRKLFADEHGKTLLTLARDLAGTHALLADTGPFATEPEHWYFGFLFSPALTIGGGTSEVQRDVIAESILGLPRDVETNTSSPKAKGLK